MSDRATHRLRRKLGASLVLMYGGFTLLILHDPAGPPKLVLGTVLVTWGALAAGFLIGRSSKERSRSEGGARS